MPWGVQLRSNPLTCLGTPTYAMVAMPAVLASFSLIHVGCRWCGSHCARATRVSRVWSTMCTCTWSTLLRLAPCESMVLPGMSGLWRVHG